MKIGFFSTGFPYKWPFDRPNLKVNSNWGGVEEVTYQLVLQLNTKGHDIIVFTTSMDNVYEVQHYGNITVYRYPVFMKLENTDFSIDLLFKPLQQNVDILHIQRGSPPGAISGWFYSRIKKKPFVLSYHGEPEAKGSIIKKVSMTLFNLLLHGLVKDADLITALSSESIKQSRFLKDKEFKIKVVPNGINMDSFDIAYSKLECRNILSLPASANIILFVGSLTEKKAPHVLLKAMKMVITEIPNSCIVFVGDGKCRKKLEHLSQKLGIETKTHFAGFVNNDGAKIMYYKSADIFVLPSFSDAFPMTLLEASTMGLPLIVSELETLKAIIRDNYNGLFTKIGEECDLSKKIIFLLQHEQLRLKLGNNSRNVVKKFSWDIIAEEMESIYTNIIGCKK